MKRGRWALIILFCTVGATLFAGCTGTDPIVGTWTNSVSYFGVSSSSSITFSQDGTFNMQGQALGFGTATGGTWKKMDDGSYSLSTNGMTTSVTMSSDKTAIVLNGKEYTKQK